MKTITNYSELNQALNNNLSLILCKTKSCLVCSSVKEKLIQLINEYKEVNFYEIYLEDFKEFQGQSLVFSSPTIIIFKNTKEIFRKSRFIIINEIKELLNNYKNK